MTEVGQLLQKILEFRDARNWKKFHNPKDLAVSVAIEAAELLELFQWKSDSEVALLADDKAFTEQAKGEVADVFIYLLLLAHELGIDPVSAATEKVQLNESRFPTE